MSRTFDFPRLFVGRSFWIVVLYSFYKLPIIWYKIRYKHLDSRPRMVSFLKVLIGTQLSTWNPWEAPSKGSNLGGLLIDFIVVFPKELCPSQRSQPHKLSHPSNSSPTAPGWWGKGRILRVEWEQKRLGGALISWYLPFRSSIFTFWETRACQVSVFAKGSKHQLVGDLTVGFAYQCFCLGRQITFSKILLIHVFRVLQLTWALLLTFLWTSQFVYGSGDEFCLNV